MRLNQIISGGSLTIFTQHPTIKYSTPIYIYIYIYIYIHKYLKTRAIKLPSELIRKHRINEKNNRQNRCQNWIFVGQTESYCHLINLTNIATGRMCAMRRGNWTDTGKMIVNEQILAFDGAQPRTRKYLSQRILCSDSTSKTFHLCCDNDCKNFETMEIKYVIPVARPPLIWDVSVFVLFH